MLLNLIHKLNCFEKFYLFIKLAGDDDLHDKIILPKLQSASEGLGVNLIETYEDDIKSLPDVKSDLINLSKQNLLYLMTKMKNCQKILGQSTSTLRNLENETVHWYITHKNTF